MYTLDIKSEYSADNQEMESTWRVGVWVIGEEGVSPS